jgi:hypothetical protein
MKKWYSDWNSSIKENVYTLRFPNAEVTKVVFSASDINSDKMKTLFSYIESALMELTDQA